MATVRLGQGPLGHRECTYVVYCHLHVRTCTTYLCTRVTCKYRCWRGAQNGRWPPTYIYLTGTKPICNRTTKLPDQTVIKDVIDRSRMPLGLFRFIDRFRVRAHVRVPGVSTMVQAPVSAEERQYYHDSPIRVTGKQPCKETGQHITERLLDINVD